MGKGTELEHKRTQALERSEALPLAQNPAAVYLAGLSEGSRRTMKGALDNVAEILTAGRCKDAFAIDWAQVQYQHVAAVRSRLDERYAASTVNKHLSAVRRTLEEAFRLGQVTAEQYQRVALVDNVDVDQEPTGRMLDRQEVAEILAACTSDPSAAGARDAAIIALWAVAGPRRAEIVNLDVSDYREREGAGWIRHSKRNKSRTVYLNNGAQRAMNDWLETRARQLDAEGPLFVPVHQSGKMRNQRLSTQAVYNILNKRADQAGVDNVTPHDFRRTAISNLIDQTDLATAQAIAGHADPRTTSRYDRRGERAKMKAAARMDVDYEGFN